MLIHKFGTKPTFVRKRLLSVMWKPHKNVQYQPRKKSFKIWEIPCQEELQLLPKETKNIRLHFGVEICDGMVFISLKQDLKLQNISILNETIFESVDDIFVSLHNSSSQKVSLLPGQVICFISYII